MALTKRIICCLDIKDGQVVKGISFENLSCMGDPALLAQRYMQEGADELVLLDITATTDKRKALAAVVTEVARHTNIPFTVGGGISQVEDAYLLLEAGADKISVNSAAVRDPNLITRLAQRFGSQCVVLAVDARATQDGWQVYTHGGRNNTGTDVLEWVRQGAELGAGEILLTSIDRDGQKNGFDLDLVRAVAGVVNVPLIASGGAGEAIHFAAVLQEELADAALAAGIFHRQELCIPALKNYLNKQKINVRL